MVNPLIQRLSADHGRVAAAALIVVLAIGFAAFGATVWNPARSLLFDAYQRILPREVERFPVIIVDIDDASLAAMGRWPWPRTQLAQLIEATHRLGALAVGLDILMPEADSLSPGLLVLGRSEISPEVRDALAALPSNDKVLAKTLREVPTVVARAALAGNQTKRTVASKQTPVVIVGPSPLPYLESYAAELVNIPDIEAAASGHGYVNDTRDSDGAVRAMALVIAVNGAPAPVLALELLRVATGERQYNVKTDSRGLVGVQLGDSFIPTDRDGRVRLHFSPAYAARRVSAAALLRGELPPKALANQVAIIGATAVGISDIAATPLAGRMDGVEVQAQLVENILYGSRLIRTTEARWWELAVFIALGFLLIFLLPRLRPVYGALIFFALVAALLLGSFAFFQRQHLLYDPSFPIAGNFLVVGVLLTAGFSASDRRRRELGESLGLERRERQRVLGELRAAREIQMGMLADPASIHGLPPNVEVFALLEPAQEVGGDLYDAFMLDEHRLFFMIGDVSGKGVPASLFMALTKTLSKSLARREKRSVDRLLCAVNQEISQENPAAMFVTAIMGIVDARSGEVELCNAGHNAPLVLRANTAPRTLEGAGGPPLCFDENFLYTAQPLKLEPGEILLLITDGVSEAEDDQQAQYGSARVIDFFDAEFPGTATAACEKLRADVKRFTAGAPASDDLTIMAIRFVHKE
ncbi:MAG: CHASE2 domain-containing protein [Candidatus Binatia bacterium]